MWGDPMALGSLPAREPWLQNQGPPGSSLRPEAEQGPGPWVVVGRTQDGRHLPSGTLGTPCRWGGG